MQHNTQAMKLAEVERVRPGPARRARGSAAGSETSQTVPETRLHPLQTITASWTAHPTPELRFPRTQTLPIPGIPAPQAVAELHLSPQTLAGDGLSAEQVVPEADLPGAQAVAEVDLSAPQAVCGTGLVAGRAQTLPLPARHLVPGAVSGDRRRYEAGLTGVRRCQSARAQHGATHAQVQLAVGSAERCGEAGRRRLRPVLGLPPDTEPAHQDAQAEQQTDGDAQRQVQDQTLLAV